MTHEKKHSTLPLSQPEVYNKDLEKLVEVLQDKLEGLELREEFLKGKVQELQQKFYKVGVTGGSLNYAIGYFNTYVEAHAYLKNEIESYLTKYRVTDMDSLYLRIKVGTDIAHGTIIKNWTIDSYKFGEITCNGGVIKNLLMLARQGELLRVDGEGA